MIVFALLSALSQIPLYNQVYLLPTIGPRPEGTWETTVEPWQDDIDDPSQRHRETYFSQLGQERWLHHFVRLQQTQRDHIKRSKTDKEDGGPYRQRHRALRRSTGDIAADIPSGYFLDIGANDGYTISNTVWLEAEAGWTGVLVEPQPSMAFYLQHNRPRSIYVQAAAADEDHLQLQFEQVKGKLHQLSGVSDHMDDDHRTRIDSMYQYRLGLPDSEMRELESQVAQQQQHESLSKSTAGADEIQQTVEHGALSSKGPSSTIHYNVTSLKLSTILDTVGMNIVDFMSLDIEGGEIHALKGFDFSKHVVNVAFIEDAYPSCAKSRAVRRLMADTNLYMPPIRFHHDLLYLRKQPVWSWDVAAAGLRLDEAQGPRDPVEYLKSPVPSSWLPPFTTNTAPAVINTTGTTSSTTP